MKKWCTIATLLTGFISSCSLAEPTYTVLNANFYKQTVIEARASVEILLKELAPQRQQSPDSQIAFIVEKLADRPYLYHGAMGEGDWQSTSLQYQPGGLHVSQYPVYRMDGFDCQTWVQVVMALFYSRNLKQFDSNIIKVAYGALGNTQVHYENRNHFIEGDFNHVNQQRGWLSDAHQHRELAAYSQKTRFILSRKNWFAFKQKHLSENVQVLNPALGNKMVKQFQEKQAIFSHLKDETITLTYLPKTEIALAKANGHYQVNQALLNKIPTPSLVEIVYDANRWRVAGKNIKSIMGSQLGIGHLGVLYRQTFHKGEFIYHRINCGIDASRSHTHCLVKPVTCDKTRCEELMLAHATYAYPKHFYWYRLSSGRYVCSPYLPKNGVAYTHCNRVEHLPLFAYLTDFQYGSYWYMNWPPILGIHIEKLV